jgi:hypothetical protein
VLPKQVGIPVVVVVLVVVVVVVVVTTTANIALPQFSMSPRVVTFTQDVPPPAFWRPTSVLGSSLASHATELPETFTSLASHASSVFTALPMTFALTAGQGPLPGSSVRNTPTQLSTAASMSAAVPEQAPSALLTVVSAFVLAFVRQTESTPAAAFFAFSQQSILARTSLPAAFSFITSQFWIAVPALAASTTTTLAMATRAKPKLRVRVIGRDLLG